jgi:hypothetical protein
LVAARDTRPIRVAASKLASSDSNLRLADASSPFAFHARAQFVWLPYCDEETALRYLRMKGVNYVVVSEYELDARPYLKKWLEEGVPNSHEVAPISGTAKRVRLFKLDRLG